MVKVKIKTMDDIKKQIVDRLKQANNILVTVRNDPTVDLLSACIGLSLVLDKMDKHAAAVFSGKVPSAMEFLKPEDTIEQTPDSLRDFIIALDKSKADKLRYKVEDTVVRIFITPYKTSLSQADLEFSQGDFNVDVVVALGAHEQQELDQAITVHGRILHDATIISVNNTPNGNLGSLAWQEIGASSISEMVAEIVSDLQKDALDSQIATALLTGIVAETERFSNDKTTPRTMTVAGELMTAGANQQLVATSLQAAAQHENEVSTSVNATPVDTGNPDDQPSGIAPIKVSDDGTLEIDHGKEPAPSGQEPETPEPRTLPDMPPHEETSVPMPEPSQVIRPQPEPELPKVLPSHRSMLPTPSPAQSSADLAGASLRETPFTGEFEDTSAASRSYLVDRDAEKPVVPAAQQQPTATMTQPQEPTMPLLHHDEPAATPPVVAPQPPIAMQPPVSPADMPLPTPVAPPIASLPPVADQATLDATPPNSQTLSQIEESVHSPHTAVPAPPQMPAQDLSAARDQVMDALASTGPRYEPLQSFNASPLGSDLHAHTVAAPVAPPASPSAGISVDAEGNLVQGAAPQLPQQPVPNQAQPDMPTAPLFNRPRPETPNTQPGISPNDPPPVPPPMTPSSYF